MQSPPLDRVLPDVLPSNTQEPLTPDGRPPQQLWRIWLVIITLGLLTSVVIIRLVHHQLLGWLDLRPSNVQVDSNLPRGVIVDRNGELLAADRFFYRLVVDPSMVRGEAERQALALQLQELIGLPAAETSRLLFESADRRYLELAKQLPLETGNRLQAFQQEALSEDPLSLLQSISILPAPARYYPQGLLASHILGFVRAEGQGSYGVEEYYNVYLDSRSGIGLLNKSRSGLEGLPASVRQFVPSFASKDLVLTLDSGIQWIIEDELRTALARFKAASGTIIVMEPKTGAILGLANSPAYDPNRYSSETDYSRFVDPAVSRLYEPGSIFKIVPIAAALDTGVIEPTTVYTDNGSYTVGQRVFFNSDRLGYGPVSVTEALARSLNVVTAQIAVDMGSQLFYDYIDRFGFTLPTEVDLADEVRGLVKMPGNPDWSLSDLGTNSFGQGLAVTPIAMLNSVSVVANGGYLMRPYIVQSRVEGETVLNTQPTIVRAAIRPETAHTLRQMMLETIRTGNQAAGVAGYRIGGKSGTAEIPGEGGYLKGQTIASFIGFAPVDDPQFVILVKIDRPDPGISIWATHTAAPVFAQVARRLFDHLDIPPDEIRLGPERLAELDAETFRILYGTEE